MFYSSSNFNSQRLHEIIVFNVDVLFITLLCLPEFQWLNEQQIVQKLVNCIHKDYDEDVRHFFSKLLISNVLYIYFKGHPK
jgi:hypothetical protein